MLVAVSYCNLWLKILDVSYIFIVTNIISALMNNKNRHASHMTDMNSLLLLLKFELGTQKANCDFFFCVKWTCSDMAVSALGF